MHSKKKKKMLGQSRSFLNFYFDTKVSFDSIHKSNLLPISSSLNKNASSYYSYFLI
jgi:hypothetical protein